MAGRGVALREVPLKSGRCDYLLIVGRVPVGIIEAKKEGSTLLRVSVLEELEAVVAANLQQAILWQVFQGG